MEGPGTGSEQVISRPGDGRGRRAPMSNRGRGRDSPSSRGRAFRQNFGPARGQERQNQAEGSIGQPEAQVAYPPGLHQTQQRPSQGFVVSLLDSYGFIRVPGEPEQIFFHGSEVRKASSSTPDQQFSLHQLLQLGDEVSFELRQNAQKEKKINAVNIYKLQPGTVTALQSAGKGRYRGTVKSTPGESSWRSQDITPGKILFSKPSVTGENAPEQHAEYKPADLREPNLKLRTGDKVEFSFAVGDGIAEDETQARDITLVARAASAAASGGRQLGCIVAAKEGFGFIRPAGKAAERIYFKAGDVVGISAHAIPLNREVSFVMVPDPRGRQDVAANVQLLPSTLQADQLIPETGSRRGRVAKLANTSAVQQAQDGLLTFTEGQATLFASYGQFQVKEGTELKLEDEVSFCAGLNAATGAYKALSVSLEMTANERENKQELGQIKSMKKEFGFINCCERVADMFFHHSALSGAPEAFAVGADVSFKVAKEPKGDRLNAVEIQQAPQGSAVFEEITDEQQTGKVIARLAPPRGYNTAGESGLVAFDGPDGKQEQLPFGLQDLQDVDVNPGAGDAVTFKVATNIAAAKLAERSGAPNRQYAGRRATAVAMVQQQGLVVTCAGLSGVVEFSPDQAYDMKDRSNKQRIPFQVLEESSQTGFKPSDIVHFVVVTDVSGKQRHASCLALIKEGDGVVPDESSSKNPKAMKFTGGTPEAAGKVRPSQAARIARGPDGTRGFTAALQPGNRASLLPPPAPAEATPPQSQEAAQQSKLKADDRRSSGQSQRKSGSQPRASRAQLTQGNPSHTRQPDSASKRPTAILQPPPRQQSASPVPRQQSSTPASTPVAAESVQPPQPASAQLFCSPAQINGIQPKQAQSGTISQSRRQRQQRTSLKPGHALHRHAQAEQATLQAIGSDADNKDWPIDASDLPAQQSNVVTTGASNDVAFSSVNGVSFARSKKLPGSPDVDSSLQRTPSGKLRATAAPFVPSGSSLKP